MDFIFGPPEAEKTTCLLHLANQYIIDNNIKPNTGYILFLTPPHTEIGPENKELQNQKGYVFKQYFTNYQPQMKNNMDLIKPYILGNIIRAFGLMDNFRLISNKVKGLKLILIDDIIRIITPWVKEIINRKYNMAKPEEKEYIISQNNKSLIFNDVFQQFLKKISLVQKCYKCPCFVSININKPEDIKNSTRIFNSIYPFAKSSFLISQKLDDKSIFYNEANMFLDLKTDKIEFKVNNEDNNDFSKMDKTFLAEYINKIEKETKKKEDENYIDIKYTKSWIKNTLDTFLECINDYKEKMNEFEQQKKMLEDSSLTQSE
jgi:hypothetical protein